MKLTDLAVRKAKPGTSDYRMADGGGLTLLIRSNGSKLWRWRYRFAGKEKQLAVGAYPDVSLSEAREARDQARKILRDGRDPSTERRRASIAQVAADAGTTFEEAARAWHALNAARWTERHKANVKRGLERDIFPKIGHLTLEEINGPLLLQTLRRIEGRGAIETAKRIRQQISMVYVYAMSEGLATSDPAESIAAALKPKPPQRRQPAVTELKELRELIAACEALPASPIVKLASRFSALTAQRPGMIRFAEWEDFLNVDFFGTSICSDATWRIPAAKMKLVLDRKHDTSFDHHVPLAPEAVDVLRAIYPLTSRSKYPFPGHRSAHKPLSENAVGSLYNRAGWHGRHCPHGWRSAFSTVMNERAEQAGRYGDRAIIDLMLAHTPKDRIESAYNRASFMPRRRDLAEEWAKILLEGAPRAAGLLTGTRRAG